MGAADYDQLSALGERQCLRLGEHLHQRGQRFEAVLSGTLKRHRQSVAAIVRGMRGEAPAAIEMPQLDEFDGEALMRAISPAPLTRPHTPDEVRAHFRRLRDGLHAWMAGRTAPQGMPSYGEFRAGVEAVLDRVRTEFADGDVLVVSSGGPISTAVSLVLGTTAETSIELNMRLRNSAVSEFAVTPRKLALVSFNTVPHLVAPEFSSWVTHA